MGGQQHLPNKNRLKFCGQSSVGSQVSRESGLLRRNVLFTIFSNSACSHIPMTANCCSNLVKEEGYVFRLRVNHVDRPVRKSIQIVKKQSDLYSSFFTLGKYLNCKLNYDLLQSLLSFRTCVS